ncbi:MAG TPA: hypothetical protein VIY29_13505 [Ktedonobacteraceae bacterium]
MAEDTPVLTTEHEWHKKFALDLNHLVWTLLDKADRTPAENDNMINAAHASHFHWDELGTAVRTRGEWLIAHVYAVLEQPEATLYHAQRCLNLCHEANIKDFDIAYGYEAMARAYALLGRKEDCEAYLKQAQEAGEHIQDKEDREIFFGDFVADPWCGMR